MLFLLLLKASRAKCPKGERGKYVVGSGVGKTVMAQVLLIFY